RGRDRLDLSRAADSNVCGRACWKGGLESDPLAPVSRSLAVNPPQACTCAGLGSQHGFAREDYHLKVLRTFFAGLALGAVALAAPAFAQDKGAIGIAMPTQSSLRWISDGNELKAALEAMG